MVATFVRPADADLAAMSKRANSPLSPEGAEAWYRTDIAWLLQEVVYLRSEIADARRQFHAINQADAPDEDTPLPRVAEWWQGHASGIWERAQTKRLKDQLAEQKRGIDEAHETIRALLVGMEQSDAEHEQTVSALQNAQAEYAQAEHNYAAVEAMLKTRLTDMDTVVAQLRMELDAERKAGERNSQMTEALVGERFGQVRELLQKAIGLL